MVILFRLFRPKDDEHPDRASQPELGRLLVDMILVRLPGRRIEVVMDGAYASQAWRGLPDRVSITTRMHANAALSLLRPARREPSRSPVPTAGGAPCTSTASPVCGTGRFTPNR